MAALPLSRALLEAVLADQLSDRFVCELVWDRLGYQPPAAPEGGAASPDPNAAPWIAGPATPPRLGRGLPHRPRMDRHPPRQRAPHPLDCRRAQAIAQAATGLLWLPNRRALPPPHPPRHRRQLAAGGSGRPRRAPAGDRPPTAPAAATGRPGAGAPGGSASGLRAQSCLNSSRAWYSRPLVNALSTATGSVPDGPDSKAIQGGIPYPHRPGSPMPRNTRAKTARR